MTRDHAGEHQNDGLFDYDAELCRYHERLRVAIDVKAGDHVLDIGCGTGQITREAARTAVHGSALGVDVSARRLERARRLGQDERLHNLRFEQADAQTHPFPPERFTLGISRFGTMFFADPLAAFTNIGCALRPGARLVQMVWQGIEHQQWDAVVRQSLADGRALPASAAAPSTLADPDLVEHVMTAAGFTGIEIADVREPIYYGPDAQAARDAILRLQAPKELLAALDAARAERALGRLDTILTELDTGDGVWFDSRAWIITAHRA